MTNLAGQNRAAGGFPWILLAGIIAVLAIVAVVHWPVLSAEAITFDDEQFLLHNHLVRNPSLASVGRFFGEVLEPSTVKGYYLPLAMTSLMLDCAVGGSSEHLAPFHRTSLVLHLLNTALLILFLFSLFGRTIPALVVGLIFGIHPLTVEPLAWIGERKTLLAAGFSTLALLSYVRFARGERWRWYGMAICAYFLALLSKPTAAMLPVLLILIDYWPLRCFSRRTLVQKLPFFILGGIFAVIILISHSRTADIRLATAGGTEQIPLLVAHLTRFYIMKFLWPTNLSLVYPLPEPFVLTQPTVLLGVISSAVLVVITLLSLRKTRALCAGLLFFFAAILPALGLIQYSWVTAADKYMYLPMLGLLMVLAAGWIALWKSKSMVGRVLLILVVIVVAAAQAHGTRGYLRHWRTTIGLHQYMLALTPDSDEVLNNLGVGLIAQGRREDAIEHFRRAIAVRPSNHKALSNLGSLLAEKGALEDARRVLQQAVRIAPNYPGAHFNLGNTARARGELAAAEASFRRAIELQPDYADAHLNLGNLLFDQRQYAAALDQYEQALAIEPTFAQVHGNRGNALRAQGRLAEALASYRQAAQINPNLPNVQSALGLTLMGTGELTDALYHLRLALQLRPGWLEPRNAIAWILATHPDGTVRDPETAIRMAEAAAAETEERNPGTLDTLGAAYAADGRFADAIAAASRALALAQAAGASRMAASIAGRLELYRQNQPFRCKLR